MRPSRHTPLLHALLAASALAALALAPAAHAKGTGLAYITSEKDNAITMVDVNTLEVKGTIKTCKRPRDMLMTPDKASLMVVCSDSGKADIIDIATRKSTGTLSLGEDPELLPSRPMASLATPPWKKTGSSTSSTSPRRRASRRSRWAKSPRAWPSRPMAAASTSRPRWPTWST